MAFDPVTEDYQRMALRTVEDSASSGGDALSRARRRHNFKSSYYGRRNSLPQTDADRAFYLVVQATHLIDYELPFTNQADLEQGVEHTCELLDEALKLDAHCYDALRMRSAIDFTTPEEYYRFLADGVAEVKAYCEEQRDAVPATSADPELERHLAIRPYLRWVSALAMRAIISGRYSIAAKTCKDLLHYDPYDLADARYTLAFAYAKLEDAQGLEDLMRLTLQHFPDSAHNAWLVFARASYAFRQRDFGACDAAIADLLEHYPHAAQALITQNEYPEALFARIPFDPYSDNELLVALSEATVLWQEGLEEMVAGCSHMDPREYEQLHHTGTFGTYLLNNKLVKDAAQADARSQLEHLADQIQQHRSAGNADGGEE